MNYILLAVTVICVALQSATQKTFNLRTNGKGTFFFTGALSFVALLFFLVSGGKLHFEAGIVPYALGFGFAYMTCTLLGMLALSLGPLSLFSLISSYSLMIPTFYGLIFLKEPMGKWLILGIVLLVLSIFFMNKKDDAKGVPITLKWALAAVLSAVANGMCSTVQKMQQVRYDGAYKNEFMVIALGFVVVVCFLMAAVKEGKQIGFFARKGTVLAVLCGLMNGLVNLLVMVISGKVPSSVMFPVISAGGLVLTFFIAKFVYKEEMSKRQTAGLLLGIAAVIFLNL